LNSCKLHDGLLTSSAADFELYMGGTDYYIYNLITTSIKLTGYVIVATPITVNGDLIVEGILENYYWSWADISVNGNITNNGTIRNNNTIGNAIVIESTGDIINNGTWEIHETSLVGNIDQSVTLIGNASINSNVRLDATTGKTTYQWYKDGSIMPGQTVSYLSLNPVTSSEYGVYNCLIDATTWSRNFIIQDTAQAGIFVSLKVFLDGPFNTSEMNTDLNSGGYIPLSQPYNAPPWNYSGTEAVAAIPNADIVDWVLVELRDATEASLATSQTIIAQQAAFLLKDGSVVGLNGIDAIFCASTITNNLFVVIWHRNSIGIMSAFPLTETGGIYSYDFTTGEGQVYGGGNAHKEIATGVWGMTGADGNADGQINNADKLDVWAVQAGSGGYQNGDFNLDAQVNNSDKNDVWIPNTGLGGQVPN
ncbi:MAG: hypothetical protein K8R53_07285, partial [Bacteroidales bacterium]|nr:hypothetical protein [Bacteroidales bacterium]